MPRKHELATDVQRDGWRRVGLRVENPEERAATCLRAFDLHGDDPRRFKLRDNIILAVEAFQNQSDRESLRPSRATRRRELLQFADQGDQIAGGELSQATENDLGTKLAFSDAIPLRGTMHEVDPYDYRLEDVKMAAAELADELKKTGGAEASYAVLELICRCCGVFEEASGQRATHSNGTDAWRPEDRRTPQSKAGEFVGLVNAVFELGIPNHTISTQMKKYIELRSAAGTN